MKIWSIHNNRTQETRENLSTDETLNILRIEQPQELPFWFAWTEGMDKWDPVVTIAELDLAAPDFQRHFPPPASPPPPLPAAEISSNLASIPQESVIAGNGLVPYRESEGGQLAFDFQEQNDDGTVQTIFEVYWMEDSDTPRKVDIENLTLKNITPEQADLKQAKILVLPLEKGSPASPSPRTENERRKYARSDRRYRISIQADQLIFKTYSKDVSLGGLALEAAIPSVFVGKECKIQLTDSKTRDSIHFPGRLIANRDQNRYFNFFRASPESINKLQKWLNDRADEHKSA